MSRRPESPSSSPVGQANRHSGSHDPNVTAASDTEGVLVTDRQDGAKSDEMAGMLPGHEGPKSEGSSSALAVPKDGASGADTGDAAAPVA